MFFEYIIQSQKFVSFIIKQFKARGGEQIYKRAPEDEQVEKTECQSDIAFQRYRVSMSRMH